jgi:hypothetical protein
MIGVLSSSEMSVLTGATRVTSQKMAFLVGLQSSLRMESKKSNANKNRSPVEFLACIGFWIIPAYYC